MRVSFVFGSPSANLNLPAACNRKSTPVPGGQGKRLQRSGRRRFVGRGLALVLATAALACGPDREARLAEIRSLQQGGAFAATLEPLRELLAATPDDPELNHLYGVALLRTRQPELAIWPLRKAAQDPTRAIDDGLLLARALMRGGGPYDAVEQVRRVLELAPDRVDALRLLIQAELAARQNEQVLVDVERLLALEPGDPDAQMSRLVALLNLERTEEAEQALDAIRSALEQEDPVQGEWEPRLCAATATFAKEKGDATTAEVLWNECLERFPGEAMIVVGGVEFFDERSDPRRSMQILRRAHEADPTDLLFLEPLAARLAASGRGQEAEQMLLAATRDGVNQRQAWLALAAYYERRDELVEARDAMGRGLGMTDQADPGLLAAYVELLIRTGDLDEAAARVADLEDQPVLVHLLRGRLHLARGEPAEALVAFDEGLRLWPDNSVARWLAAQAAEQLGDYERALAEYREAVRNDPGNLDALLDLVRWLDALGVGEEALPLLARYQREHPRDPHALVLAIRLADRAGKAELVSHLASRLAELPGQRGVAAAEIAALRAQAGGPEAGIRSLREARLNLTLPRNGPALRVLVELLVADGRAPEALQEAEKALTARPDVALFHELRGVALRATGEPAAAQSALDRALALEPERATALAELAALTVQQGDPAAALALYDRAARAEPEEVVYAWAAIQLLAGADDAAAAAELERRLETLLARYPTHAGAAELLARQLRERDPDRALELARRAARFDGGAGRSADPAAAPTGAGDPGSAAPQPSASPRD